MKFTRKKLAIIAIAILILGTFVVWATRSKWGKNLNVGSGDAKSEQTGDGDQQSAASGDALSDGQNAEATEELIDSDGEKIPVKNEDLDPNKNTSSGGNEFAHITTEHCNTDCKAFANNLVYLEYCQQVCGLAPIRKVSDCNGKEGIEKDYCLKDLGIMKGDSSICDGISDSNIKKTCKNRIAQDLIEEQMSQPLSE